MFMLEFAGFVPSTRAFMKEVSMKPEFRFC